jgi:hypothetical protein
MLLPRSFVRRPPLAQTLPHCVESGFGVVATFPVVAKQQVLGVYNLFYKEARTTTSEERHMLATLGKHLGAAVAILSPLYVGYFGVRSGVAGFAGESRVWRDLALPLSLPWTDWFAPVT